MTAQRGRTALRCVVFTGLVGGAFAKTAAAADRLPSPWLVEPEARVGADVTAGSARAIIHETLELGVGVTARREGWAWRARAGLDVEPLTDIGAGASLQIFRAHVGVERDWRRHLVTALDLGGAVRRLSIADEITRTAPGITALAEIGWRVFLGARWSLTAGLRSSTTWFFPDQFLWQEIGVALTLGRAGAP
jgi:hypothetical protein